MAVATILTTPAGRLSSVADGHRDDGDTMLAHVPHRELLVQPVPERPTGAQPAHEVCQQRQRRQEQQDAALIPRKHAVPVPVEAEEGRLPQAECPQVTEADSPEEEAEEDQVEQFVRVHRYSFSKLLVLIGLYSFATSNYFI